MNFSSTVVLSQAWELWKKHIVFSWIVLGVIVAINIIFAIIDPKGESFLLSFISTLVTIFFSLGVTALFIKLVRTGEEGKIEEVAGEKDIYIQALIAHLVLYALVIIGFLLLIIPGIYLTIRFMFLTYVLVDKKLPWKEAMQESSRLTEGYRWNLLGFSLFLLLINIVGVLFLFIGLLVSLPVSMIATTMMYEWLKKEKDQTKDEVLVEEKKEEVIDLPAATPEPAI